MNPEPDTRLLYICENRHEVASLVPVARAVAALSGGHVGFEFGSLDPYYFQGVDQALEAAGVPHFAIPTAWPLGKPLTALSQAQALRVLLRSQKVVVPIARRYDGIVCGVDPFVVRMLLFEAQRLGRPTFQVFNAHLFELLTTHRRSLGQAVRARLRAFLCRALGAEFLRAPGTVCQSGCRRVFVMGQLTGRALEAAGVANVRVTGVPRFSHLFAPGDEPERPPRWQGKFALLYLPGACAWHGYLAEHHRQQQQLRQIADMVARASDYHLVVKNHPREDPDYYAWLSPLDYATFLPATVDLNTVIRQCDVTLSTHSTAIGESVVLKRPSIAVDFPAAAHRNPWRDLGQFPVMESIEQLRQVLDTISRNRGEYDALLAREEVAVQDLFAPGTPHAAEAIAREILQVMGVAAAPAAISPEGEGR
ncbi:MAG: hypothetical protein GX774_02625 [Armatimonadetes bacterium]|nr:hypothetical protein [Armatimonadota bacterium]